MSLLKVNELGKSFGGVKAVDGISFELKAGELLALIGPNGAGKSTTFNMVNGQLKADRGSILLDGQELVGRKPREIWRMGVGRTFQIAETFASLTVVENVQMALLSHDHQLFSTWRRAADHKRDEALALLDQVGMKPQADRPCSVLAYGDVKRVELAIAMANAPKLLLMDEPTAGMAPKERNSLMALTKQLVIDRGMAVPRLQWAAFVVAGTVAGLAGSLFAFAKGTISPETLGVGKSVDGLVMVLLGGVQAVSGPWVGGALFTWLQDTVARQTDYWRALLGLVMLALVLVFPLGVAGGLKKLFIRDEALAPSPRPAGRGLG